ncbi:MAG: MBL fold metallo-hydrolase [Bacilli bacterium]|nr:MBL fold metallo-hydrolase [Bacilli bacterium]
MIVKTFSNNQLHVNTYFMIEDGKCLIIDPGSNAQGILKVVEDENLKVLGIVLTHAHFDHFLACNELNRKLDVPLYIHPNGVELLYDPMKNVSGRFRIYQPLVLHPDVLVSTINEETTEIEGFKVRIFHIPGHSPDGISLYFAREGVVFTGDALFKLSIGRTDFYGGNQEELVQNIKEKLLTLPKDTIVYPGHGPATTIEYELAYNIYIK